MARRTISIEEKIERQKQVVSKHKAKFEAELQKLDQLMAIRDAELDKELLAVFHNSGLSHQEAIDLLAKNKSDEDEDSNER